MNLNANELECLYIKHQKEVLGAFKIRVFEKKLLELYSKGHISGTVHTCIGQELVPVIIKKYSLKEDFWLSNHRGHGHFLAWTDDYSGLFSEILGSANGVSGGHGGSQHLYARNFLSNGIQAGLVPVGCGIAQVTKESNSEGIVVVFIGDGTLGQGVLYESMNLASIWSLPVLIVVENNGYAQSTSQKQTFSGSLKKRAEGFGLAYYSGSTQDLDQLDITVSIAIKNARLKSQPTLLEINTFRLNAHSKGDDNRANKEIANQVKADLLNNFEEAGLISFESIESEIDKALDFSMTSILIPREIEDSTPVKNDAVSLSSLSPPNGRLGANISNTLQEMFEQNNDLMMIGEDIEFISPYTEKGYGGAFKISGELSKNFPGRVKNTPISESCIVGFGIGRALKGKKTFVEIMFGDFITLAFDQILQQASKIPVIFGRSIPIPLCIRTPMGGYRGYGPTHSQSLESFFLGIPNLVIVALNTRISPKIIFSEISKLGLTCLLIENKVSYTIFQEQGLLKGYQYLKTSDSFPIVIIRPKVSFNPVVTICCYGYALTLAESAAEKIFFEREIFVEIICFSAIQPLNINPLIESISVTSRLLIVQEGKSFGGFGATVLATINLAGVKIENYREISNESTISSSLNRESLQLPSVEKITQAIYELLECK